MATPQHRRDHDHCRPNPRHDHHDRRARDHDVRQMILLLLQIILDVLTLKR